MPLTNTDTGHAVRACIPQELQKRLELAEKLAREDEARQPEKHLALTICKREQVPAENVLYYCRARQDFVPLVEKPRIRTERIRHKKRRRQEEDDPLPLNPYLNDADTSSTIASLSIEEACDRIRKGNGNRVLVMSKLSLAHIRRNA